MTVWLKILPIIFCISTLYSQYHYEHQFVPFDGERDDLYGKDVALSDSFIFIGSSGDENYTGSVYVYKMEKNNWTFTQKLTSSNRQENDWFGYTLFLDSSKLFIGSRFTRVNNITSGALFLYTLEDGNWLEKQKIIPPILQYEGLFSGSVTSYKDFLLVGASNYQNIYESAGRAFLYKEVNDAYEFIQELVPSDPQSYGRFGNAVIMDSTTILIGSSQSSTVSGNSSGSVYLFKYEDSLWVEKQKYVPDPNSTNLGYGCSIGMNDKYVFIGAYGEVGYVGPGSVYIYERSPDTLKFLQKIDTGFGYENDHFGFPIKIKKNSVLIGAIADTTNGETTGTAYLFINRNGSWVKSKKFKPSDEDSVNYYSLSLDISHSNVLIGAPESIVNEVSFIGKAYLYTDNPVSVENEIFLDEPVSFSLSQNYPNPFNSQTTIEYYLAYESKVKIEIFDATGQLISTIINSRRPAGIYSITYNFDNLSSGVYFYKMNISYFLNQNYHSVFSETRKALLIK